MLIFTGQILLQLPLSDEANGRLLYFVGTELPDGATMQSKSEKLRTNSASVAAAAALNPLFVIGWPQQV
jgi:hypothetical protein